MVSTMQMLGIFFKYSGKRQRKLEQSITENATESLNNKVKLLCETRWVERYTAFTDLSQLYESTLHCLESIWLNNDLNNRFGPHSVTEASRLRKQLRSSSFIVCFQTCKYLYGYTKGLSQQLEGSTVETAQAYEMVSVVAAQLNDIRDDAASEFQNVFTKCQAMAALADTTITVPRTVSRQNLRDNVEHENAEQYYRRTVFIPFLDCLVQQLNDRFQGKTKDAIKGMYFIPSNLSDVDDKVEHIKRYYSNDLPNEDGLIQEIKLWKQFWKKEKAEKPKTLLGTLEQLTQKNIYQMFPNIVRILSIILTTPATSASVERANSALRYVKTDFRSTMSEDRFNALLLLFVHRNIRLDYKKFLDMSAVHYPRRMVLKNPLTEQ